MPSLASGLPVFTKSMIHHLLKIEKRVEAGWQLWEEVKTVAANREKWRHFVKALCATRNEEDR